MMTSTEGKIIHTQNLGGDDVGQRQASGASTLRIRIAESLGIICMKQSEAHAEEIYCPLMQNDVRFGLMAIFGDRAT